MDVARPDNATGYSRNGRYAAAESAEGQLPGKCLGGPVKATENQASRPYDLADSHQDQRRQGNRRSTAPGPLDQLPDWRPGHDPQRLARELPGRDEHEQGRGRSECDRDCQPELEPANERR